VVGISNDRVVSGVRTTTEGDVATSLVVTVGDSTPPDLYPTA
jgi:hypothetical protein